MTTEQVEKIVVDTLESTPKDATHWSRRSMAEKSGLSASTIGRIWHAFELKPHRTDGFKLSNDPMFVERSTTSLGCTSILQRPRSCCVLRRSYVLYVVDFDHDGTAKGVVGADI